MNNNTPILILAFVFAIMLDLALMYFLQGLLKDDKSPNRVTFLGSYSPILTWFRNHSLPRLPRLHIKIPAFINRFPWTLVGLILFLLIAGISQWQLLENPETPGWPLFGYFIASVIFIISSRRILPLNPPDRYTPASTRLKTTQIIKSIVLLSLSLAAGVYLISMEDRDHTSSMDLVLVIAWLMSILLFIAAILLIAQWSWPNRAKLAGWWRDNWRESSLVLFLFVLALLVRVIDLPWFPYAMINDEGEVGMAALGILNGSTTNIFNTGWGNQPILSFIPNAFMITMLGNNLIALRLVSAIEGALAVVFLYLLAREAFGREVALLAAVGLVGLAWHIHFSRLGVHNIIDSFFATLVLWLTYRATRRGGLIDYLWAGLAAGLTVYTYVGSRLVLILAFGLLMYGLIRRSIRFKEHALHLLVFIGAVVVVAAPIIAHFARFPGEFMARMNGAGLIFGDLLEKTALFQGQSKTEVLLSQFSLSTLVYVTGEAPSQFFFSPRPYLPWIGAMFLILGLAYATWRAREPRFMMLCLWLWMVVILGSTLTSSPPSNQRLIMSAPAVTLLVAIGLWQTAQISQQFKAVTYRTGLALSLIIMCAISVQGIGFYFGEYRQGHFFEDPAEVFSYEVGLAARELGPDYRLMVVGQPVLRSADGNFGYLDQNIEKMDFNKINPETLAALPLVKGFLFAAIPLRRVDLEKIAKWFPGGKWNSVPNRFRPDEISYYTYLVKPEIVKSLKPITPPTFDPYQQVIESPDGRFSAKLRKDWGDQNDKPVIEVWDQKGSLLWKVPYQYPEVTPYSRMMILQWSPDSTEVYFYYPYSNNLWYTIFNGSDLQSLNVNTGEVKDIVAGCCVDFDFSPDMKKVAYTSENKAGILDLVTGQDKRVDILPHAFEQSGRIFISPSKEKVVFQTLSYFTGTSIFLDATTMDQKIIMSDYLISDYEFDGWSSDEKPRYRKGDEVITIDLDTLSQTTIGTVTPQP